MLIALFAALGDSMQPEVWQDHGGMHEGIVYREVTVIEGCRKNCWRALKLEMSGFSSC